MVGREPATSSAAAAASALPRANVQAMTRLTLMPMSPATVESKDTARIAVPNLVR